MINAIPENGWWHPDGAETFLQLADHLITRGFSEADAVDFLTQAFSAVAAEYGD